MKRKKVREIAKAQGLYNFPTSKNMALKYESGFIDGAEWRINSVWHDKHDEPALNKFYLWIDESGNYSLDINYRKVASWASYVDVQRIVKWAYVDDLKPNMEE